jgi:ADP-ribosylglycohydrolase
MAVMVRRLLEDEGLREAVDAGRAVVAADPADFEVVDAIDAAIALAGQGSLRGTDLETLGKRWPGGPGDEALAIAVAAVLAEPDPNEALLLAVNHGGDSDSTGAIAGNLLGAHYGASALRADWRERVELADVITEMAGRLSAVGN